MDMRCDNCKFWDNDTAKMGDCRRKSPSVIPGTHRGWPRTNASDWCGKFKSKV